MQKFSNKNVNVVVGIQARSNSTRLPNKALAKIGGITVIEHVIEQCRKSITHINRDAHRSGVSCSLALLIPTGDSIRESIDFAGMVVEGSEADVLSRYKKLLQMMVPDYVVRVTGDCPLLPPFVITKHIREAVDNQLHYITNTDPEFSTSIDGWDVEVLSSKALRWLCDTVTTDFDKEHVTTYIKSNPPEWMRGRIGHVIGHADLSHMKLSVDTADELEVVRAQYESIERKVTALKLATPERKIFRL